MQCTKHVSHHWLAQTETHHYGLLPDGEDGETQENVAPAQEEGQTVPGQDVSEPNGGEARQHEVDGVRWFPLEYDGEQGDPGQEEQHEHRHQK